MRGALIGCRGIPIRVGDGKQHYSCWWYTIILNHPRGWGGKPIGSLRDSRVAEMSPLISAIRLF